MSITDKLRSFTARADGYELWCPHHKSELISIADDIDVTHAEAQRRWMAELDAAREQSFNAGFDDGFASADDWLAQHEDAMREHGWVKLPKDADGEHIRIGDAMEWVRYEDDDPTIVRKVSAVGAGVFFAWSDERCRYAQYDAQAYRHYKQPTVEDVLREFGIDWEHEDNCEDRAALLAEYAKRLKLAGENDG